MCSVHFSFTFISILNSGISKCSKRFKREGQFHLFLKMTNDIWQYLCQTHVNSNVYAKFYQNIQNVSRDRGSFTGFFFFFFFRIKTWTSFCQSQMTFDNLMGYILSISMCMQNFITISHSVRLFSLFPNLELGTASTDIKCHFAITWARFDNPSACLDHFNSNVYAKCYQNIPKDSRDKASFTFFRI